MLGALLYNFAAFSCNKCPIGNAYCYPISESEVRLQVRARVELRDLIISVGRSFSTREACSALVRASVPWYIAELSGLSTMQNGKKKKTCVTVIEVSDSC